MGRVVIFIASARIPARWLYLALPALMTAALMLVPQVGGPTTGVLAFGFAGLGCSAFSPVSISRGQKEFVTMAAGASGGLVVAYQIGYGLSAFGGWTATECGRTRPGDDLRRGEPAFGYHVGNDIRARATEVR
jgi:hypothetical protein